MSKKRKGLIILFLILLLVSILGILFQEKLLEMYMNSIKPEIVENGYNDSKEIGLAPKYNSEDSEPFTPASAIKYREGLKFAVSKGRIIIPSVGIDLGIYEGINNEHLMIGAAEQYPRDIVQNGNPGNYVLASHMSSFNPKFNFAPIQYGMKEKERIYTTDRKNLYVYEVVYSKVFDKSDTTPINEDSEDAIITLYTCYNPENARYPHRRTVIRGHLINTVPLEDIKEGIYEEKFAVEDDSVKSAVETLEKNN